LLSSFVWVDDIRFTEEVCRGERHLSARLDSPRPVALEDRGHAVIGELQTYGEGPDASTAHKVTELVSVRDHVVYRQKILCLWT
ncbi:hypothetical protein B296_00046406, partial [Ensete ventricosum]